MYALNCFNTSFPTTFIGISLVKVNKSYFVFDGKSVMSHKGGGGGGNINVTKCHTAGGGST
jgi:hypothetical protein